MENDIRQFALRAFEYVEAQLKDTPQEDVPPLMALFHTTDGKQALDILVMPHHNEEEKSMYLTVAKARAHALQAHAAVHVAPAWMRIVALDQPDRDVRPRDAPDRIEVLIVAAHTPTEVLLLYRTLTRTPEEIVWGEVQVPPGNLLSNRADPWEDTRPQVETG